MQKSRFLLAGLALVLAAGNAAAQTSCTGTDASCSVVTTASMVVPTLVSLSTSSGTTGLGAPVDADLITGYKAASGPTLSIKANKAWTLSVKTTNATNFDYTGTESGVKPISDLTWSATSSGTFAAITGSDAQMTNGTYTNTGSQQIFFRTLYPNDYSSARVRPGTYSINLTFTVAAP